MFNYIFKELLKSRIWPSKLLTCDDRGIVQRHLGKVSWMILTNFSKALGYVKQDLLISKLVLLRLSLSNSVSQTRNIL